MNWFKRMVVKWVREDWEENGNRVRRGSEVVSVDDCSNEGASGDPILNFRVYSAVGGRIVEFRRYDRKHGNNEFSSYIITEDQNFGERIAKIATIENLKA